MKYTYQKLLRYNIGFHTLLNHENVDLKDIDVLSAISTNIDTLEPAIKATERLRNKSEKYSEYLKKKMPLKARYDIAEKEGNKSAIDGVEYEMNKLVVEYSECIKEHELKLKAYDLELEKTYDKDLDLMNLKKSFFENLDLKDPNIKNTYHFLRDLIKGE